MATCTDKINYWLLDWANITRGTPDILSQGHSEHDAKTLTSTQLLTTEPDFNFLARFVISPNEIEQFPTEFHIDDVLNNRLSIDLIKGAKHFFLLGDRYEIVGKLSNSINSYFKIQNIMGFHVVLIKTFRLGAPID